LGNYLWIPARIVIALAIIIVGTRLGIITNQKGKIFDLNEEIKFSILLKLFILPFIVFLVCKYLNFNFYQSSAVILQAGTPTAISTILMAEAYGGNHQTASKILFATTLISIITIPLFKIGGTISKVNVVINNATDIKIIIKETLNSSLKKKGKPLYALFCFCTFFICKCTFN